jgi:hypothetical protein
LTTVGIGIGIWSKLRDWFGIRIGIGIQIRFGIFRDLIFCLERQCLSICRLVADRIVGSPIPEYDLFFRSRSRMRSTFKISRNRSNPLDVLFFCSLHKLNNGSFIRQPLKNYKKIQMVKRLNCSLFLGNTATSGSLFTRSSDQIRNGIGSDRQISPVEWNVECDPFLFWIAELECHPKKSDRSQACPFAMQVIFIAKLYMVVKLCENTFFW